MPRLSEAQVSDLFLAACRAELAALKPGNVHVHAGGHGMEVAQFEVAAEAAAPWVGASGEKVGTRILRVISQHIFNGMVIVLSALAALKLLLG